MIYSKPILRAVLAAATFAASGAAFAQDARVTGDLPIGLQMYTLRNAGNLDEQLTIAEAAGVTAVETVGTQDVSAEELKAALDKHKIKAISTHVQIDALRTDLAGVIAFNKAIGNDTIIVPHLKPEARPTDAAGWTALGEELKGISAQLKAEDMQLAYHNHDFEMVDMGGRTALEVMMEAAGDDVLAELDVAWISRAGLDPAEYVGRFDGRIFAIHAKDHAPAGEAEDEKGFKALGEGVMDFAKVLPAAEEAGTKWYIIEHDLPKDASVVVKTGADYLTTNLPEGAVRD